MGTVLLVVLIVGAVVFLMNRSRGTGSSEVVNPVKPTEASGGEAGDCTGRGCSCDGAAVEA